ncbi:MAG: protoglobin domain-containing protein [Acidobacteriota bacterium]
MSAIAGYTFGAEGTATSPVSEEELRQLEATMRWSAADAEALARHAAIFERRGEEMVDAWRAVIGAQPHLAQWFFAPDGKPDEAYKARVKARFVQWVVDVATRPHDRAWLDYQEEIGLRHTPAKKNKADGAHTPAVVPLRYLLGFLPVVTDIRELLRSEIGDEDELRRVEIAWGKAVHLHVALWTRAYVREGLW